MEIKFTPNQVLTLKMSSGEEIIAKIVAQEGEFLIIEEPVAIGQGPKGIGLVPALFTAEPGKKVRLNTNNINFIADTDEPVKMKYLEATTGIQVPEKKLILG
jgi:hypothetical protein